MDIAGNVGAKSEGNGKLQVPHMDGKREKKKSPENETRTIVKDL
jgi:hypothetical protein